jgi:hypothetical protein
VRDGGLLYLAREPEDRHHFRNQAANSIIPRTIEMAHETHNVPKGGGKTECSYRQTKIEADASYSDSARIVL